MELIYLWIDHYANIIKKGFNFSPEYNITYDEETLSIKDKQNNSINLFHENFLNITAIIGENGSGKTSLLSFIEYFFLNNPSIASYSCILILKDDKGRLVIHDGCFRNNKELQVTSGNIPSMNKKIDFGEIQRILQPIFYSSGIEIRNSRIESPIFWKLTGNSLLKWTIEQTNKDLLRYYDNSLKKYNEEIDPEKQKDFAPYRDELIRQTTPYNKYLAIESKNKLDFIFNHNLEDYDFIPKYLSLNFNGDIYFDSTSPLPLIEKYGLREDFINVFIRRQYSTIPGMDNRKEFFREGLIFSIYLFLSYYSNTNTFREFDLDDLTRRIAEQDGISAKADLISEEILKKNLSHSGLHFEAAALQDFVKRIDEFVERITFLDSWGRTLVFKIDDVLKDFYNLISTFWNLDEFIFSFNWTQMSSGQSAILTLFSRLYFSGRKIRFIEKGKIIWLFVDEGELYIHPEWQRRFFNDLHKFLPKFYPENKIQLLISTHSPYVASDIPKTNIIMLKRAKNTACEIVDMELMPETFGANIHELLANSFFMENGTIGEFAKGIINDLFNYLTDKETSKKWNPETTKNAIQIVGEPMIKDQLLMLYDIKLESRSEAEDLRVQKARIDARLKELGQNDTD
ncbi:MAG: AAA family ATPase [Prolixibacteraceae bacterium]|nr:AAA family ATPase [Prolixibacteraceae bacterium]